MKILIYFSLFFLLTPNVFASEIEQKKGGELSYYWVNSWYSSCKNFSDICEIELSGVILAIVNLDDYMLESDSFEHVGICIPKDERVSVTARNVVEYLKGHQKDADGTLGFGARQILLKLYGCKKTTLR